MTKLPSFQFYPGDWQKDLDLRRCSHGAKGVWIDMLCLMHESEERGVLITGGCPWSEKDVAAAIGGNADVTLSLISELLKKGVAKRRESDGAIYCARMVREEAKKIRGRDRVHKYRENQDCNADVTSLKRDCNVSVTEPPLLHTEDEVEDEVSISSLGGGAGGDPKAMAMLVLCYLNEKCHSHYRPIPEHLNAIRARLESVQWDVAGVKQMIDRQYALWAGDSVMDKCLNPKTLFRASNFPSYYDDRSRPVVIKPKSHRQEKEAREFKENITGKLF